MRWLLLLIVALPSAVFAAPRTYKELADLAVRYINYAIALGIALGFVIYLLGIAVNMNHIGKSGWERFKVHVLWGLVAMFVMVSVFGIVSLVRNTLFSGSAANSQRTGVQCATLEECGFGNE